MADYGKRQVVSAPTWRDEVALCAMEALVKRSPYEFDIDLEWLADRSYGIADAMIEAFGRGEDDGDTA